MPYNSAIPQPGDTLSQSQDDILNNFSTLSTAFNLNHGDFNAADQGKHNFVEMTVQNPVPTTIANEVGLYCQLSTYTSQPELVFAKQAASTAPIATYEITSAGYASPGWTRLPSGILLKWGTGTTGATGNFTITFPVSASIPVFGGVYIAFTTAVTTSSIYTYVSATTTTLTLSASVAGTCNYLVLGY